MPTKVFIQQEKDFTSNMTQLMEVMKSLALASYVKLKKQREKRFTTFVHSFDRFFHVADLTKAKNPFIKTTSPVVGIVLVTSEESFMSALNSKVLRLGLELAGDKVCHFMITGKKIASRLKSEGYEAVVFPRVRENNMYKIAVQMKDYIAKKVKDGEIGPVLGVYAEPVSFSSQQAVGVTFLPAHDVYPESMNEGVDPNDKVALESSAENLMDYLTQIWITNKLFAMFQDSRMSEFAAQSMQLEGSLMNLAEVNKKLKVQFAKKRGEIIDTSLREIISALMVSSER